MVLIQFKHVLNVGLLLQEKIKEIFEYARQLENEKIQFHFVGNQAPNFQSYWEPLMNSKPQNCIIWGKEKIQKIFIHVWIYFYSPLEVMMVIKKRIH